MSYTHNNNDKQTQATHRSLVSNFDHAETPPEGHGAYAASVALCVVARLRERRVWKGEISPRILDFFLVRPRFSIKYRRLKQKKNLSFPPPIPPHVRRRGRGRRGARVIAPVAPR